jgi:hypothetical protein
MHQKRQWLILLVVLALAAILLLAAGCGEEEGMEARATADELAEDASAFAEGFCAGGTATPAIIVLVVLAVRSRRPRSG